MRVTRGCCEQALNRRRGLWGRHHPVLAVVRDEHPLAVMRAAHENDLSRRDLVEVLYVHPPHDALTG